MKAGAPTIMQHFTLSPRVFTASQDAGADQRVQIGLIAVQHAAWLEKNGEKVILKSECWKLKAPDIWQAT